MKPAGGPSDTDCCLWPLLLSPVLCCRAANPTLLELTDFRDQVLAPFLLSEAQHAEACAATISHDQPLPQPADGEGDDWNLAGGSSAAGGGAEKQQQSKQSKQSKL